MKIFGTIERSKHFTATATTWRRPFKFDQGSRFQAILNVTQ